MILILGRFQPLHNGHLKAIEDAYNEDNNLIIAIGSSQKHDEKENPFSGEERRQMLERTLKSNRIPARIVLIPDIKCDSTYTDHIEQYIGAKPDRIITENQWTFDLFSRAGYDVKMTPRYFNISSTAIRELIADGGRWQDLVPEDVMKMIREIDGINRIKNISRED